MYIVTHFHGRQDLFGWMSCQNLENCFKGLLSLVGYLVHLRQNGEKHKGPSIGSRIKRFEYRKFPLGGKWYCTQICKITTGHRNTIQELANMMVFLLVRNFISTHAKTWSVLVSKEIIQWPSGTVLPGFDHMLTLSVWIWDFVTEVLWVKFHHLIYESFWNICNSKISRYLVSKNRFSLKMGTSTVCTVCPLLDIVILKQNPHFSFMEWAGFWLCGFNYLKPIWKIIILFKHRISVLQISLWYTSSS